MNDVQSDELLALDSILADRVSWTLDESSQIVQVNMIVEIDLGDDHDVIVEDFVAAPLVNKINSGGDGAAASGAVTRSTLLANASTFIPNTSNNHLPPMSNTISSRKRGPRKAKHASEGSSSDLSIRSTISAPAPSTSTKSTTESPQDSIIMTIPKRNKDTPGVQPTIIRRPLNSGIDSLPPTEPTRKATAPENAQDSGHGRIKLRYLPPIEIVAILSSAYPLDSAPESIRIVDRVGWLRQGWQQELESKMMRIWSSDECLYSIVDLVQGDQIVNALNFEFPLCLKQDAPEDEGSFNTLSSQLSAHDLAQRTSTFSLTTYTCSLCLSLLKGARCVRLSSCSDVFCSQCLKDYYSLLITEGMVRSVTCPGVECTTARVKWEREHGDDEGGRPGTIEKAELRGLVGDELVERYEWLVKKQKDESDPSVSYCPRCQTATPQTDDEKLRICPSCDYPFCVFCRRTWHGPRNPCALPQSSAIVTQYLAGDSATQATLEQRYGKTNIRRLVAIFEEERLNREWLDKMTMSCPGCQAGVEKSHGCNHMQCSRCSSHFCFRCGKSLSPLEPYRHFSTPGSSCYNKLFDRSPGEGGVVNEPPIEEWLGEDMIREDLAAREIWHEEGWNPFGTN